MVYKVNLLLLVGYEGFNLDKKLLLSRFYLVVKFRDFAVLWFCCFVLVLWSVFL